MKTLLASLFAGIGTMKTTAVFSFFVILLCSTSETALGQVQYGNYVYSGAVGIPMTFTMEIPCVTKDPGPNDYLLWDFGPGASPQKPRTPGIWDGIISVHFSQDVTYLTPGDKTVSCSCFSGTMQFHIYDCTPAIPHHAIVISADTIVGQSGNGGTYWVNPGVTLTSYAKDTVFAESGSTITGSNVCYMKAGSKLSGGGSVIYADGVKIEDGRAFALDCPTLNFDYTNAPPNPAHSLSVRAELDAQSISLSPNPTGDMVHVQGLPSGNTTLSIYNLLGEVVVVQKDLRTQECTLDLSKLSPGAYYVRIVSANSVVTKKVIKN